MQPAGITELISTIENAKCPIICICNVETIAVQKLSKYVEKVRFWPVSSSDVKRRVGYILKKEGITFVPSELDDLIESCDGDIRKTLNQLQWYLLKETSLNKKDPELNDDTYIHTDTIFNMVKTLMNSKVSLSTALEYYHCDSMMIPLFVHENYPLGVCRPGSEFSIRTSEILAEISDAVSESDIVGNEIYSHQLFDLMPYHGLLSTVIPVRLLKGQVDRLSFPVLLGKTSSLTSKTNGIQHITNKMSVITRHLDRELITGPITLQYFSVILYNYLTNGDTNAVKKVVEILKLYRFDADDFKELFILVNKEQLFKDKIDKKTKSAITRAFKL
jgi:hypothetical protein